MAEDYADSHNLHRPRYGVGVSAAPPPIHEPATASASHHTDGTALVEILLSKGLVSPNRLRTAVKLARDWQVSLGEVLIAKGWIRPIDYYRTLAQRTGIPFADLERRPPDSSLLKPQDIRRYLSHRFIPLNQSKLLSAEPYAITTPRDVRNVILRLFADRLMRRATSHLKNHAPWLSADRTVTFCQLLVLAMCVVGISACLWLWPTTSGIALNVFLSTAFLSLILLRIVSLAMPLSSLNQHPTLRPIPNHELPIYTILVPLFRESRMLPHLSRALMRLDYPAAKLDIKFIFEEEDTTTLKAAKALRLPGNFEFLVAPKSFPQTKPKALNFALPFARGTYTVIYDAEDMPDPKQLRCALNAFRLGPTTLACVQARLNFYNARENWLSRQFAIEYAALFDLMLPTLDRLGLPLPLGGTSNHFRTDYLRRVLGWDPYNVTEDADLGIRFARLGYETQTIDSITYEEAASRLGPWLRQRSRWLKGWMQTYFVHMRNPIRLFRELGLKRFVGFQMLIGAMTMSALLHPIFLGLMIFGAINSVLTDTIDTWLGTTLFTLNGGVLLVGYVASILAGMRACHARGKGWLATHALFIPIYWLLISLGGYKALWQFITQPFYWEKTEHGVSDVFTRAAKLHF